MFTLASGAAGYFPGILFYKVLSPTPWIFSFAGFSSTSDLYTLRVGEFFHTRCIVGTSSTFEGCNYIVSCLIRFWRESEVV